MATRSIFVAPATVGALDDESHHIAYDEQQAWLCSDARSIDFLNSTDVLAHVRGRLEADSRPLREKISELVEGIHSAEQRASARIAERKAKRYEERVETEIPRESPTARPPTPPPIPTRPMRELSEPERKLRELSDIAARLFDTQVIIVQP